MAESEILSALAGGGAVSLLAGLIFAMYRNDRNDTINRCVKCKEAELEIRRQEVAIKGQLFHALTELTIAVVRLNSHG